MTETPSRGAAVVTTDTSEIVERARGYLAMNAAESGADILIEDMADTIERLTSQLADAREKAIEDCAKVAETRAAICADAVAKIDAGNLYAETSTTSRMTEECARLEAIHIAGLIRALKNGE